MEGALQLTIRCLVALYFIYSLWRTRAEEFLREKKLFYSVFGIIYSIWFFALPLCVAILVAVDSTSRRSALVAVSSVVDIVAYCIMAYMIYPGRQQPFFKIAPPAQVLHSSGDAPKAAYGAIE